MLCDQFQSKIAILEHKLNKEKREYVNQLQRLYERNAEAIDKVKQVDATMQSVSTKIVHLGDQLESVFYSRFLATGQENQLKLRFNMPRFKDSRTWAIRRVFIFSKALTKAITLKR
ncbi:hypothetical protein RB195_001581 [Necator americanus]|uniref:Exocyst complex component 5 n=1 Tax=Necator americanus TaxID=51031 RepID=A0ABR1DEZ1_NECAM